jgi:hypothetical protein
MFWWVVMNDSSLKRTTSTNLPQWAHSARNATDTARHYRCGGLFYPRCPMEIEFSDDITPNVAAIIRRAIEDTQAHDLFCSTPWMENRRVFRFGQFLASEISQSIPSKKLRPYLEIWYYACRDHMEDDTNFEDEKIDLTYARACAQFATIWDGHRIKNPVGYHWAQFYDKPEPDIATEYDDPKIRRLITCLYHAASKNDNWLVFITQTDAGKIMDQKQLIGRDALSLLCSDEVIHLNTKGRSGRASEYQFLALGMPF